MCESKHILDTLIDSFEPYLTKTPSQVGKKIHSLPKETVTDIVKQAEELFSLEESLLQLNSPIIVLGDLHGHVLDLVRFLKTFGCPTKHSYLFLGDLVDRGEFQVETALIIFLLKIVFPSQVFVIRGNHEFDLMCKSYGFHAQILIEYDDDVYSHFLDAFSQFPIGAVIDKKIFCIHGGITPQLFNVRQISKITRPMTDFPEDSSIGYFWNDPADSVDGFPPSDRGVGNYFGSDVLDQFLEYNKMELVVRAHECVMSGCVYHLHDKCLTVFGASNYCNLNPNRSGIFKIEGDQKEVKTFPPIDYIKRNEVIEVSEKPFPMDKSKIPRIKPRSPSIGSRPPLESPPSNNPPPKRRNSLSQVLQRPRK